MPISFSIEPSTNTVYTTITGPLLDADPVIYLSEVLEHPDYRPGMSALVVCENVEIGSFSTPAVRLFAEFTRGAEKEFSGSRIAVVAPQLVFYGIVRMYQLLRDPPYQFAAFRELDEAKSWLESYGPDTGGFQAAG